jgi:hypothetical protein
MENSDIKCSACSVVQLFRWFSCSGVQEFSWFSSSDVLFRSSDGSDGLTVQEFRNSVVQFVELLNPKP